MRMFTDGEAASDDSLIAARIGAALLFFCSSRRRHTRSVSAFLLNRSSDLTGKDVNSHTVLDGIITTLPTAYDVYPLDGRHDGGYYTVKDCVTIDVLPRTPGNNVYVGFKIGRASCRERV